MSKKDLSKNEALRIIDSANKRSLQIRKGEIVTRVKRHADRGDTVFSIRLVDVEKSAPRRASSQQTELRF